MCRRPCSNFSSLDPNAPLNPGNGENSGNAGDGLGIEIIFPVVFVLSAVIVALMLLVRREMNERARLASVKVEFFPERNKTWGQISL